MPQAAVYEQLQLSFVAFWLPFEFRPEDVPVVARGWEGLPAGLRTGLTPFIEVYFHIAGRTSLLLALQRQSSLRSGNRFFPWPAKPAPVPPEVLLQLPIQTFIDSPFLLSLLNFFILCHLCSVETLTGSRKRIKLTNVLKAKC